MEGAAAGGSPLERESGEAAALGFLPCAPGVALSFSFTTEAPSLPSSPRSAWESGLGRELSAQRLHSHSLEQEHPHAQGKNTGLLFLSFFNLPSVSPDGFDSFASWFFSCLVATHLSLHTHSHTHTFISPFWRVFH